MSILRVSRYTIEREEKENKKKRGEREREEEAPGLILTSPR